MTMLRAITIIVQRQSELVWDYLVVPRSEVRGSRARPRPKSTPHTVRKGKPVEMVYIISTPYRIQAAALLVTLRLSTKSRCGQNRALGNAEIQVVFTETSHEREGGLRLGRGGG
jgi:hypothetical protein